jgi:hypothetical protein
MMMMIDDDHKNEVIQPKGKGFIAPVGKLKCVL